MSIIDRLAEEITQLRGMPEFDILHSNNDLVPQASLRSGVMRRIFDDIVKVSASGAILESLAIDDKMFIHWRKREPSGDGEIAGEFNLQSALLFAAKIDIGEPFMSENDYGMDLNTLRVIDYSAFEGGPIYALLPVADLNLGDDVIVFNKEKMLRTSLTYASYLETLLLTRGFLYWQYLFCEEVTMQPYENDAIVRAIAFLKKSFPSDDFSSLDTRLSTVRR